MKVNTAIALILCGVALGALQTGSPTRARRVTAIVCSAAAALLGAVTLVQDFAGWDFGIDQLLLADGETAPPAAPGRMSSATALNATILAGTALTLLTCPKPRRDGLAQGGALVVLALSLIAIVGYATGAEMLYQVAPYSSVSLYTALAFVILSAGILLGQVERGWMARSVSPSAGGVMLRQVLLPGIALLGLVAWVGITGERLGLYGSDFGVALMLILSARRADRLDLAQCRCARSRRCGAQAA